VRDPTLVGMAAVPVLDVLTVPRPRTVTAAARCAAVAECW